jgi:predicted metal-binding protein
MQNTDPCAIQISHITNASYIFADYSSWKQGDDFLDFEGAEMYQGMHQER